jgi:hypothetical protein
MFKIIFKRWPEAYKDGFQKGRKERSRLTAAFEGQSLGSRPAVTAGKQLSRRAVRKTGCEQNSDKMRKGAVSPAAVRLRV